MSFLERFKTWLLQCKAPPPPPASEEADESAWVVVDPILIDCFDGWTWVDSTEAEDWPYARGPETPIYEHLKKFGFFSGQQKPIPLPTKANAPLFPAMHAAILATTPLVAVTATIVLSYLDLIYRDPAKEMNILNQLRGHDKFQTSVLEQGACNFIIDALTNANEIEFDLLYPYVVLRIAEQYGHQAVDHCFYQVALRPDRRYQYALVHNALHVYIESRRGCECFSCKFTRRQHLPV